MTAQNWREFVASISPTVLQGVFGERYMGFQALVYDALSDGLSEALKVFWLDQDTSPDDALTYAGIDTNLERYPNETPAQHRARLLRAWPDWQFAGDESAIEGQLAAAGFVGATVYDAAEWNREPTTDMLGAPWWSRFWVFFPAGSHPVTARAPIVGTFKVGDGTVVGPVGGANAIRTIRGIVQKWKPADWVAVQLVFEISGWTVGSGHVVGEPGLVVGGEVAVAGAV